MSLPTIQDLVDDYLTVRLGWIQKVEAYNLRGMHTSATVVELPFKNITTLKYTLVNGNITTPDSTDLTNGLITVNSATMTDDIDCTYVFQYFSNTDLKQFYYMAMSQLNSQPPKSTFVLDDSSTPTPSYPTHVVDYLTTSAYIKCLQTVLVDLMGWKARLIWADPVGLAQVLQGLIMSAEQTLASMSLTIKGRSYLTPYSVSAGRYKLPSKVTEFNWQQYSIIGATSGG